MKKGLGILLLILGVMLCASNVYAAQAIVLDPLVSREVVAGQQQYISVGATFKDPGNSTQRVMSVTGIEPSDFHVTESSCKRIAGVISASHLLVGDNYLTVTVSDYESGLTAQGTFKVTVIPGGACNKPIIFDSMEQIKVLSRNTWYSLVIGATDVDPEQVILDVTGAASNPLGYASFTQTTNTAGRVGGVLNLYMQNPGQLNITLSARDNRPPSGTRNNSVANLKFVIQ